MTSLPLLVTLCSYFLFSSEISVAVDTIGKSQSVTDNQTLVSSGQTFELGFFSMFNTKNRYLGITYKISGTIIWVANRNNPVTDSSGVFTISKDGNIIVLNGSNYVLWSTNISKTVQNPVVQLLESGNLVLKDGSLNDSRNYQWESFDYPSDTLLPGMKLGWDLKTGLNRNLKSWKHIDDPSIGDYSYGFDLTELLPELVIRNGLIKEFRTGVRNGTQFRRFPSSKSNPFLETTFILNTEVYFSYEHNKNNSSITRLQLDPWGKLRYFKWDNQALNWTTLLEIPKDQCDNYNKCGTNGLCNINKSQPCDCLKGFVPKSQQKDVIDWRVGCSRRTLLECENGDKFESIERVKLPDMMKFSINKSMGLDECKMECSRNCSCTAYANSNISENGNGGCILWFGELLDIRQLTDESWQVLYIRLAASEKGPTNNTRKRKSKVGRILGLSVGSTLFLFCLVICYIIWRKRTKGAAAAGISEESREEDLELPLFDLTTVETATNNFSQANEIGKGGFGPVYKGKLAEGQEVAVKRLSKDSGQGVTEFKNEVIMIAKLQHRNLVKLLGCCIHGEERILIYEYMPNKSLDYFIFDEKKSKLLDWQKRSSIIAGIARGLLYLHQDSRLRIIHRDLKASNILLDFNMNPKISDFGLARIFRGDQTEAETKRVVGTYGYMPPEYAIDGNFSMKSDVFSFGVLLLEIVSGKRNRGFFHEDHHHNLIGHAWILWIENKALEITDPCLEDSSFISSEVLRCIQVGLLCVQQMPEDRPSMLSVVIMMGTADSILPEPKQPGFFIERNWFDTSADGSSENHVTISALEAR